MMRNKSFKTRSTFVRRIGAINTLSTVIPSYALTNNTLVVYPFSVYRHADNNRELVVPTKDIIIGRDHPNPRP